MLRSDAEDLGWTFYEVEGEPQARKRWNQTVVFKQLPTEERLLADIEAWELVNSDG